MAVLPIGKRVKMNRLMMWAHGMRSLCVTLQLLMLHKDMDVSVMMAVLRISWDTFSECATDRDMALSSL